MSPVGKNEHRIAPKLLKKLLLRHGRHALGGVQRHGSNKQNKLSKYAEAKYSMQRDLDTAVFASRPTENQVGLPCWQT